MRFEELAKIARETLNPMKLSDTSYSGTVAAVIESATGKIYKGVCIDTPSSMGFCAEHAAIAAMITAGENKIKKAVAVYKDGKVIPPCGRCRELISQIHKENEDCEIMIEDNKVVTLNELLPYHYDYK